MWDKAKAIETIVYLANRLDDPTKLKIFKLLYFADKLHMSRYGRFIVGDYYVAMQHGPVPSRTYNIIKEVENGTEIDGFSMVDNRTINPKRPTDLIEFSDSDIECLDEILEKYGRHSASELRNLSHDNAWSRASDNGTIFKDKNSSQSVSIPLEYIVDDLPNANSVRELLQREGELPKL